jgi:hypothetical protein
MDSDCAQSCAYAWILRELRDVCAYAWTCVPTPVCLRLRLCAGACLRLDLACAARRVCLRLDVCAYACVPTPQIVRRCVPTPGSCVRREACVPTPGSCVRREALRDGHSQVGSVQCTRPR